jgi:hypothetical protein
MATTESALAQGLDPISSFLLYAIRVTLDDNGAWEWNLRLVGVVSAIVLMVIKLTFHKAYGVDWFSLMNAIVTGFGAVAVVYLNSYASETMTGFQGRKIFEYCGSHHCACVLKQSIRTPNAF